LKEAANGSHFQFERQGYFFTDPEDHGKDGELVFNRVVALKDSWTRQNSDTDEASSNNREEERAEKQQKKEAAAQAPKKPRSEERDKIRAEDPLLAERYERYKGELGLDHDDADILTGERELSDFFEGALQAHQNAKSVANWVINELMRELKDTPLAELAFSASALGELVALMDDNTISSRAGKDVFEAMLATGDAPAKIVEEKGLTQISDPAKLAEIIDGVIQANAAQAEQYRAGKTQLLGFFVGQVMKASRGKADPQATREVLLEKL
jgi:glutaminyl-tRNA synthetase